MPAPLTLVVTIHAKPEHRSLVRALLLDLAAKTVREAGNLCYVLHEVADAADQFIIYEQWKDKAALDFHMSQPYLLDFLAREEELLARPIEGKFCTPLTPA